MTTKGDRQSPNRQLRRAVALLALVMAFGTAGYMLVEGWGALDAFYMTVISITTAGYEEVHPLSRAGMIFTSILLIGGVGTAFYAFTLIAAEVIQTRLSPLSEERRRTHMIEDLKDHFIVCGGGRIGLIVA